MTDLIGWFSSEQGMAALALAVPFICSIAAALFPDNTHIMRIVNFLALNVGRAKNDESAQ